MRFGNKACCDQAAPGVEVAALIKKMILAEAGASEAEEPIPPGRDSLLRIRAFLAGASRRLLDSAVAVAACCGSLSAQVRFRDRATPRPEPVCRFSRV